MVAARHPRHPNRDAQAAPALVEHASILQQHRRAPACLAVGALQVAAPPMVPARRRDQRCEQAQQMAPVSVAPLREQAPAHGQARRRSAVAVRATDRAQQRCPTSREVLTAQEIECRQHQAPDRGAAARATAGAE